ncbi:hypothetical protein TBLA_0D02710 [Henningerozyma blattae CBS 6284]|uniref:tRNA (uracil-O(2)-)-methyltransferase n=1 Tax=Henningerozyma blattae (strain ATCC 34711 / CBS 6284 / DSM 70876 / NBRC 10599 / NRRL Y-10934 / UCD 77-7) TaxID=1071380 RepID=I2H322_HENB6|nr:hypothetical protein TBLA_0D02710 [Tetrapisispora blattae CBS 6284]CCH60774.1 hypothetical protein TBLA_0D02710 [Tetrapisispora blattae CBS 6284]
MAKTSSKQNENFHFNASNVSSNILGSSWVNLYSTIEKVTFSKEDFQNAMLNVIREPNINSTVVLRADILNEITYSPSDGEEIEHITQDLDKLPIPDKDAVQINLNDITPRVDLFNDSDEKNFEKKHDIFIWKQIVRRVIPRNVFKDAIINQTCLLLNSKNPTFKETSLVIYTPHLNNPDDCPFYLPKVKSVGILLHESILSVHYLPFSDETVTKENSIPPVLLDENDRMVRTAYRLLQTANKHSNGVMQGYEKRVTHDQIISKVVFQNRYVQLKKKYSKFLVDSWVESTDPKKHVFEDISIAAFLIELWIKIYGTNFREKMQFRDLGCGNGVLVYILISEGVNGVGTDARRRKSWSIYPSNVQASLTEQVIVPALLLRPYPTLHQMYPNIDYNSNVFPVKLGNSEESTPDVPQKAILYSSKDLLDSPRVCTTEFPPNTFIIGNHSDELTCWIPLLGYPFMVIPCCSHGFSGQRVRYRVKKNKSDIQKTPSPANQNNNNKGNSSYAGLVSEVEDISNKVGWQARLELLRIPSTRNAAIVAYENKNALASFPTQEVYEVIQNGGGAGGWIENTMNLMKKKPRGH